MKIEVKPIQKNYEVFLETYPPQKSNKFLPDWYKKMKLGSFDTTKGNGNKNAKNCPAIQDYVNTGIVIPLWVAAIIKPRFFQFETSHYVAMEVRGQ